MGHQNWRYTSEKEMTRPGKKREKSGSGEKEHVKKKKRAPINFAICESKGEIDPPAFNSNRDLFTHVVKTHLEERYKCGRCNKDTDRSHVSEFVSNGEQGRTAHSCFRSSQPFWVIKLPMPYYIVRGGKDTATALP